MSLVVPWYRNCSLLFFGYFLSNACLLTVYLLHCSWCWILWIWITLMFLPFFCANTWQDCTNSLQIF
uniref:Uncharacterized protein n=1 Tax=Anguilla anguilla TaxID=7936 RepID=A0A0E9Q8U3_ANGAN